MAKLTDLPDWKSLSPKEKERLKKVFAPRIVSKYNLEGKLSTTQKELKHG